MILRRAGSLVSPLALVAGSAAVLIAASWVCALWLDIPVMAHLHARPMHWHTIPWIHALRCLGKAEVAIWLVAAISVLTGRAKPLVITLAALLLSAAVVVPLKVLVGRPRPSVGLTSHQEAPPPEELTLSARASFPSGDTSTAFAVAAAVGPCVGGPWRPVLVALAAGIGVSRVTTLNHFPSDVFAGAAIGLLVGTLAVGLFTTSARLHSLADRLGRPAWRWPLGAVLVLTPGCAALADPGSPLVTFLKVYGLPLLLACVVSLALGRHPQGDDAPPPAQPGGNRIRGEAT